MMSAAIPPESEIAEDAVVHPTANVYRARIGAGSKLAAFVEAGGCVIGRRCKVQAFAFLCPGIVLEDEVFVGPHVCFTNDVFPQAVGDWELVPTRVCQGASIGAGAVILPGVTIGEHALVGAGSVVTEDVPPGAIVYGNPARLARDRAQSPDC